MEKIARSKLFDLLGVGIVVAIAVASGYLTETLADVSNLSSWGTWTRWIPFGLISIGNSILSIYSTRLTGRMNNVGNWIGIINAVLSGTIDYLLGNKAAIITYPVTFIIYIFAIRTWMRSEKYRASSPLTGAKKWGVMISLFILSMAFSFATNLIGWQNGMTRPLFWIVVIAFGLSLTANVLNAMKLTVQWQYWFVYNFVQLIKALVQGNFANVGMYIYYIINAVAALDFWTKLSVKPVVEKS